MQGELVRWGVIGCAGIAVRQVIPAIQCSKTGTVTAVASRSPVKARQTAAEFGVRKAYDSYEKIVEDPDIDAVYIPLPNHLHREWTIRAAQAGKHVLCEKPIALNSREAQEMVDVCRACGVRLAEAFMYRYHPRYERIREAVKAGEIGEIRTLHGAFSFNNAKDLDNIRYQSEMGEDPFTTSGATQSTRPDFYWSRSQSRLLHTRCSPLFTTAWICPPLAYWSSKMACRLRSNAECGPTAAMNFGLSDQRGVSTYRLPTSESRKPWGLPSWFTTSVGN
ncbi:hypothetical protein GCM10025859_31050 [Alicyclobacillus fastidiosus]|nr:hypothetical protein GCM10025859_31050 [Alicyclobacillus fastidiosus]